MPLKLEQAIKHSITATLLRIAVAVTPIFMPQLLNAQITTSSLSGQVTEQSPDEQLIGASVVAIHQPSGTRYATTTNHEGRYDIEGMRVGGPYTITYSYVGKQSVILDDIMLELGEKTQLDIYLENSTTRLDGIIVRGKGSRFIQAKTGATTNISNAQIASMPTINRSISDIAKLSPYSNGMSFAGADGRSTNFTIDGANFNNNFGLTSQLPGGGNPISLDAIEEMQIVISPFDVRQTNFIGGGINAITKSGTNTFRGSAYIYYTDQNTRGNRIAGEDLGTRADASRTIYGFTIGGPIIKNKLFFFVNYEHEANPGEVIKYSACADGMTPGGMVSRTTAADMKRVADHLMSKYGYDPGSFSKFPGDQSNNRVLTRLDWNINDRHRLSFRFNFTKNIAWNGPNYNSSDTGYRLNGTQRVGPQSMAFANSMATSENKVTSFSLDFNSRFDHNISNQFLATFTSINDMRGSNSSIFPFIDIMAGYSADGNPILEPYMSAGYELFSYNNGVKNKVLSITDNVKWLLGEHIITAGLAYEHQLATNAYMRNGTGYYRYNSVDDFINGAAPESFALTYGFYGQKEPAAEVTFNQAGIYLQDEWNITRNFKLSYGLRLDELIFDNSALRTNTAIYDLDFGGKRINTGLWPKNRLQFSPRIGFNFDILGDKSFTLRGGSGIFTGRLPLVFLCNMPTNANLVQNSVQFTTRYENGKAVGHDPRLDQLAGGMITDMDEVISKFDLPTTTESHTASNKISGVDAGFKMPQVWKSSIGIDYKIPVNFPLYISGELIFMRNFNAVNITNWNIKPQTEWESAPEHFAGADNRIIYPAAANYQYYPGRNAVVLTNSSKGHGLIESFTVNARPIDNLSLMASYTHTANTEVSGLPGNDPVSTWQSLLTIDGPNMATVQCSQYVIPDKVIASAGWTIPFIYRGLKRNTNISLFYNAYSFNGYSYCYSNDMNGDGINNDLMYIPRNDSEINFKTAADREAFWKFVEQDNYLSKHKGRYAEAYSARSPWTHRFDLRLMEDFEFYAGKTKHSIQVSLDIVNIGNLINSKWGVTSTDYTSNNSRPLKYEGMNDKREPVFSMNKYNGEYISHSYDYLRDYTQCWQLQLGIKYIFN